MIEVFAESNNHAELWATFETEKLYLLCLPALKKEANKSGMFITESVKEVEGRLMKITPEQVEAWLGSDVLPSEIHQILAELANGEYDQKQLAKDIKAYGWDE